MPRQPKPPAYLSHRGADGRLRARVRINGKDIFLGPYGSAESHAKYKQVLSQWQAGAYQGAVALPKARTVADGIAVFLANLMAKYQDPKSNEVIQYSRASRPLAETCGGMPLDDIGPKLLKAIRQRYVEEGLCRRVANRHLVRLKTMFRWLVSEELMSGAKVAALLTVKGLAKGEHGAKDYGEVLPVPEADLAATLPELSRVVWAIAEFQLCTGARPGEALRLRPMDILRGQGPTQLAPGVVLDTKDVWVYRLAKHKTLHHGHSRFVLIGPKAQDILQPFLDRPDEAYCFSAREAVEDYLRRHGRKVRHGRKRQPGEHYQSSSYVRAIAKACERAGVTHWHPNQLRHNAASRLAAEFGPNIARIVLGHHGFAATRIYVQDDLEKAAEVVRQVG